MFTVTIEAFTNGGDIPDVFTCEGDDISPSLAWSGEPAGTKSFALIMDDPDAPAEPGTIGYCGMSLVIFTSCLNIIEQPDPFTPERTTSAISVMVDRVPLSAAVRTATSSAYTRSICRHWAYPKGLTERSWSAL
jgi:Phosphatidylethanolamine-binding protein